MRTIVATCPRSLTFVVTLLLVSLASGAFVAANDSNNTPSNSTRDASNRMLPLPGYKKCVANGACPPLQPFCLKGVKKVTGICVECLTNGDCAPGQVCGPDNRCGTEVKFSTVFSIRYTGYIVETFTGADKNQVCVNLLGLQPGGTCTILNVLPGSAVVIGSVSYPTLTSAQGLTNSLVNASSSVLTELATGLSQSTVAAVEGAVTEQSSANTAKPQAPANVQTSANTIGCPNSVSITVTWTPVADTGVIGYTVTCSTISGTKNSTTLALGATKSSVMVSNFPESEAYICLVGSVRVDQVSDPTTSPQSTTGACPPAIFSILGVNPGNVLFTNPNINDPNAGSNWVGKGTGYNSNAQGCGLSGQNGVVIDGTSQVIATSDVSQNVMNWNTAFSGPVTGVNIGSNKQGIYIDTYSPSNVYYTSDITVAGASFGSPIASPASNSIIQVSISGTAVLGRSSSNIYYIADASVGSPTWSTALNLPSGVTTPSLISLSGTGAVLASSLKVYYTSDITASPISWQTVSPLPTDAEFTGSIYGLSLSGKQIILTVNNGKYLIGNNIFLAPDVTNPVWSHPDGYLECIGMTA